MADISFQPEPHRDQDNDPETLAIIEHLFFAYRDFVGEPDTILAELGFGRAHHRVLHFVHRNPGMTVAVLLEILQITKQSLARVLKNLIETGYITQETGPDDRRQRLLYTTEKGAALAEKLIAIQSSRIEGALQALPAGGRGHVRDFLRALMNDPVTPLESLNTAGKPGDRG
ncbi:MAG: MarR family winged helix-turn-helix transcriptional regulator [Hyphomicrobiales bacterium]